MSKPVKNRIVLEPVELKPEVYALKRLQAEIAIVAGTAR